MYRELDKWEIVQNRLVMDSFRTLSELQHLIKNLAPSKQSLVKPFFEKLQTLSKEKNIGNLTGPLKAIADLMYALVSYIENRKTIISPKKKKVITSLKNNEDLADISLTRK